MDFAVNRLITWLIRPGADITLDFMRFEVGQYFLLSRMTNYNWQLIQQVLLRI